MLWDTRRRLSHWFFLKGALKSAWNEKVLNDTREEIARAPGTEEQTICWGIARMASWKRQLDLEGVWFGPHRSQGSYNRCSLKKGMKAQWMRADVGSPQKDGQRADGGMSPVR